jgi:hypothetical protein
MPSPSEIERARAAVAVACLRWLRPEVESGRLPRAYIVREDEKVFRLVDPLIAPRPQDPEHPLWDRWIDG